MLRSLSTRTILGLLAGLIVGAVVQARFGAGLDGAVGLIEAVGALWLNLLRMTVVPLIFAILVTGVASVADAAATGRIAMRAIILFTVLIIFAGAYSTIASQALITLWPVPADAAADFVAGVKHPELTGLKPPGLAEWIKSLAPQNVLKAAGDDQILPLVVFGTFFGFAATTLQGKLKEAVTTLFQALSETMIKIVHWVLLAGPIGVFALSFGVGAHAGFGAAGVLAHYISVVVIVTVGIILIGYGLVRALTGLSVLAFLRAMAPTTAVALSTQSSLASLPAMLDSAEALGVSAPVRNLVLPLAVAVFRYTSPVANLAVVYFVAHLYGVHPTIGQMLAGIFVAFAASVASVGLPGTVSYIVSIAPISIAVGAPIEILGILIAVEVIPDIFRTIGNVTGDVLAAAAVERRTRQAQAQ